MFDPGSLIQKRRTIRGMSAILLPFHENHDVDWESFDQHVERTVAAGLVPAVNMDTGYANLIDEATRRTVLERTQAITSGGEYVAGAFVQDEPGSPFDLNGYATAIQQIQTFGGTPIIFQSYGLAHQPESEVVFGYQEIARYADRFIGFELGEMFAPFGAIYSLEVYRELMEIRQCVGAKHSSLDRMQEWQRIQLRNETRKEFMVLTGNDLAIDMVMYGSDYLLGLSTFCPDLFAKRDRLWAAGDAEFFALNDVLQYLGFFAFRDPTSAYKHTAAMFLKLRGWITTDQTHPNSLARPDSDRQILLEIGKQLGVEMS